MGNGILAAGLASLAIAGCTTEDNHAPSMLRTPDSALTDNVATRETLHRVAEQCAARAKYIVDDLDARYSSGLKAIIESESGMHRGTFNSPIDGKGSKHFLDLPDKQAIKSLGDTFLTSCMDRNLPNGGIGNCEIVPTDVYYAVDQTGKRVLTHQIYPTYEDETDEEWMAKVGPNRRNLRLPINDVLKDIRCGVLKSSQIWAEWEK